MDDGYGRVCILCGTEGINLMLGQNISDDLR